MIKIQLCPANELEDRQWWLGDVGILLALVLAFYYMASSYVDVSRSELIALTAKAGQWSEQIAAKNPTVDRFKTLNSEMDLLQRKIGALKKITTSRVDKVKPLVAIDQLQTLAIDGLWYESLTYAADGGIDIQGAANDSLLISEFALGIRETMNPETLNNDLRTQLGFDAVVIRRVMESEVQDQLFPDIKRKMEFEIKGRHIEKPQSHFPAVALRPRGDALIGFN